MNNAIERKKSITLVVNSLMILLMLLPTGCNKERLPDNADPLKFTYLTEEYAPFNYTENGQVNGVSVDVLEALFDKMGVDLDRSVIQVAPWAEAIETARNEEGHMLFSTIRNQERESQFKWVGPIAPQKEIVIWRSVSGINLKQITDLNQYFTGVIEGYSSLDLLLSQGIFRANIVIYENVGDLMHALMVDHEVQCICYSEVGFNLAAQSLGYDSNDFGEPFTVVIDQLYYAFNQATSDELIGRFQNALDSLKADRTEDGSALYDKILNRYSIIQHVDDNITEEMAVNLVNRTAGDLRTDAAGTIQKINLGQAPYKDPDNSALYAFVYNTQVVMVAHATNPLLVGVSFAGKTDVAGKPFRDEIVQGALSNGSGWVDYIYTKADQSGLYYKSTYYLLVEGSDSEQYVVCAGRFK